MNGIRARGERQGGGGGWWKGEVVAGRPRGGLCLDLTGLPSARAGAARRRGLGVRLSGGPETPRGTPGACFASWPTEPNRRFRRVGSVCQVGCRARRGARITTPDEARVNYGGLGYTVHSRNITPCTLRVSESLEGHILK
jgi:hypothetical protein